MMYSFNKNNYVSKKGQIGLWKKKNKNWKLLQKEECWLRGSWKAQDFFDVCKDQFNFSLIYCCPLAPFWANLHLSVDYKYI